MKRNGKRVDKKGIVLKKGEYQRKDGRYEYKYEDVDGKRKSEYAATLSELRNIEKEIQKRLLNGYSVAKTKLSVDDVYQKWVTSKRGIRANTLSNYRYLYTQFIQPRLGKQKITKLKRSDITNFYNRLVKEESLAINTLDNIQTVLHSIFKYALYDEYINSNPTDEALSGLKKDSKGDQIVEEYSDKAYPSENKKAPSMSADQQVLLLEYLRSTDKYKSWYTIFAVMMYTGMRAEEATGLRWRDIDWENECIYINHALVYYAEDVNEGKRISKFAIHPPKTGSSIRKIPMLPIVKKALQEEKERQEMSNIRCSSVIDDYCGFIFYNRFCEVLSYNSLNKKLTLIVKDCNEKQLENATEGEHTILLPKISSHSFRSTFATQLDAAFVHPKAIQMIMGHSSVDMSLNVYVRHNEEFIRRSLEEFKEKLKFLVEEAAD